MAARRLIALFPARHPVHRSARMNSTYQPPDAPPRQPKPNPHREFYRVFGRAWLKNFLVAVATYQVIYWGWKKLESVEVKHDTESEIHALERELRALTGKESARG